MDQQNNPYDNNQILKSLTHIIYLIQILKQI